MKKKIVLVSAIVLIATVIVLIHGHFMDRGKRTTEPEFTGLARTVAGNDLISESDPEAVLRFAPGYRHIGGQKFILYGVADTEQHFFIETTPDDVLKSLYWIQFEAYLPGKPYRYDYEDSPLRVELGDYEFFTDTAVVRSNPDKRRRGTDGSMARQFVQAAGYAFPEDFAYARLVYLTDESRKKELMIIFIEDLAPTGLTAPDLKADGKAAQRWPEMEQAHLEKIRRTLSVTAAH